jgi:hypothetical protein
MNSTESSHLYNKHNTAHIRNFRNDFDLSEIFLYKSSNYLWVVDPDPDWIRIQ